MAMTSKAVGMSGVEQATMPAAAANKASDFLVFIAALCRIRLYTATPARLCNGLPHSIAPGYAGKLRETMARWQSGYAADCNSVYAGSIPTLASIFPCNARVAELVDAADLKSVSSNRVRVQVPPWAPFESISYVADRRFLGLADLICP